MRGLHGTSHPVNSIPDVEEVSRLAAVPEYYWSFPFQDCIGKFGYDRCPAKFLVCALTWSVDGGESHSDRSDSVHLGIYLQEIFTS